MFLSSWSGIYECSINSGRRWRCGGYGDERCNGTYTLCKLPFFIIQSDSQFISFNATHDTCFQTWAIRDGLGMLGGLVFSYVASPHFDAHVKEFRLLADVLNDVGLTLDMALPVLLTHSWFSFPSSLSTRYASWYSCFFSYQPSLSLPSPYLVVTSISTLCKVACGISAGATKGNITDHFAICGNRADVNAKESTQETLVSLVGMAVGVCLARWLHRLEKANQVDGVVDNIEEGIRKTGACISSGNTANVDVNALVGSTCINNYFTMTRSSVMALITDVQTISWVIFLFLTIVHVWANYVGVQRLRLRTLNRERAQVALQSLVEDCGRWVIRGDETNQRKNANYSGIFDDENDESSNLTPPEESIQHGDTSTSTKELFLCTVINKLPSPNSVSESLWSSIYGMFLPGVVHLGARLRDLVSCSFTCKWSHQHLAFLCEEFRHENYMIFINEVYEGSGCRIDTRNKNMGKVSNESLLNISVMMRIRADNRDELKAFLHAHILKWCIKHENLTFLLANNNSHYKKHNPSSHHSPFVSWNSRKKLLSRYVQFIHLLKTESMRKIISFILGNS